MKTLRDLSKLWVCIFGLAIVPAMAAEATHWQGSVTDATLLAAAPQFVQNDADLQALWKSWDQKDAVPKVDFSSDLLVIVVSRGSVIGELICKLAADGNLKVIAPATMDLRPGFRFRMQRVDRAGVTSVNGKALAPTPTLTGKVLFSGDAPLPAGAVVTVRLNDVSRADAPAVPLATFTTKDSKSFPISYQLQFDVAAIAHKNPQMSSLGVRIEKDGKLLFTSDTHTPVFNAQGGLLDAVDVSVVAVK